MIEIKEPYHLFSQPRQYYDQMIKDIAAARKYVYVQTFRMGKDDIGERFRDALTERAKAGVEVRVLIDYWGANLGHDYFKEMTEYDGEVRFFEKIKYNSDFFTQGHKRNHRKLLLIDDDVTWIGSSNLTGYNKDWRESMLRAISPSLTLALSKLFMQDFRIYNKYIFNKAYNTRTVKVDEFEIIRDAPSIAIKRVNQKFIRMIKQAKKTVFIETPYFLPGFLLRKAMIDASKRGVEISVILPDHSDVNLVDILRNKYLGPLHKHGIRFLFYKPNNLHAKLMLIDDNTFALGSSNFDYRSFRYLYEIIIVAQVTEITSQLRAHIDETIKDSRPFDYEKWLNRPTINRLFEWLLLPFRHLM